jgi:hypothetical protein
MFLLTCCQQNCMTYSIAVCTVKNSWWWTEELSETSRVSFQEQNLEINAFSWFYYKKIWFVTLCYKIHTSVFTCCHVLYFSVMNFFFRISQRISWMTYSFQEAIIQIIKCGYYHHRFIFDAVVYNSAMKQLTTIYVMYHINTIKLNLIMHVGRSVLFVSAHFVINKWFEGH